MGDRHDLSHIDQEHASSVRGSHRHTRGLILTSVAVVGILLIILLVLLSLAIGSKNLSTTELFHGLLNHDGSRESLIIWKLRFPRTALAILVGASLGVAGVLMQALTRNPLADPGILGVNSGASFAMVLALTFVGAGSSTGYLWFAFIGSGITACFVYLLSLHRSRSADQSRLVLAGTALTASLGACTGIITMFNVDTFNSYRFWVIGSLADRGEQILLQIFPLIILGLVLALITGPALNALALGEEQAKALGAKMGTMRVLTLLAITLLCGSATAAAGPIGFIGLVVPHVLRLVIGIDQRPLLILSAIFGPVLVLAADIIGRLVSRPGELEVGIVTAFIGAPVLLALLLRKRAL